MKDRLNSEREQSEKGTLEEQKAYQLKIDSILSKTSGGEEGPGDYGKEN